MAFASGRPEKESYLLVEFRFGDPSDPQFKRYTDWDQDVFGYTSTPSLEVEMPENTGILDKREARILLPVDDFTSPFASGLVHSRAWVSIVEITAGLFSGDAGSSRTIFKGRVVRSFKNFQGRNDTAALFALPIKARLDVALGLQCNHHCVFRLFGPGCLLDQSLFEEFGQIATIDGKTVTITPDANITNPFVPGTNNDRVWERGYLEKDGLKIGIHVWNKLDDPLTFALRRRPPDTWLLQGVASIRFVPGCHKTIEDCRDVWDNEQGTAGQGGFGGFGFAMLSYNPIYENPQ